LVILFLNLNANEKIEVKDFSSELFNIKGQNIQIDSESKYFLIYYSGYACSQCVYELIKSIRAEFPYNKIHFCTNEAASQSIASKRETIDFLIHKYKLTSETYFIKNISLLKRIFFNNIDISPNLVYLYKNEIKIIQYSEMFQSGFSTKKLVELIQ
jgi:hypothetical protein